MRLTPYASQEVIKEIDGELYFIIPDELVKTLGWKLGDRIQVTVTENATIQLKNYDSTITNTFQAVKDEVLAEFKSFLPKGYSIKHVRDMYQRNGYEINIEKPSGFTHPQLVEIVSKATALGKKYNIVIEVI